MMVAESGRAEAVWKVALMVEKLAEKLVAWMASTKGIYWGMKWVASMAEKMVGVLVPWWVRKSAATTVATAVELMDKYWAGEWV